MARKNNTTKVSIARLETKIDYITQSIEELKANQKEIVNNMSQIRGCIASTDRVVVGVRQQLIDHINQHKTEMVKIGAVAAVVSAIVACIGLII